MPLRVESSPKFLKTISLIRFLNWIIQCCQRCPKGQSKAIQEFSKTIPVTLANEYVGRLLSISVTMPWYRDANIRDAISPWCTRITLSAYDAEVKVLENLDRLRNLTHICFGWSDRSKEMPDIACQLSKHLPRLRKLKSLRIATLVTDDSDLFKRLARYCPDLFELAIKWGLSRNQPATLANCLKLKRVFVEYCGGRVYDVVYILDSVPQLEVLHINRALMSPLLRCIRKSYPLKELNLFEPQYGMTSNCCVEGSTLLTYLARHFPKLDEGTFFRCKDLIPINRFRRMRTLHLSHTSPEQMSMVAGYVFSKLLRLSLSDIPKLSSALKKVHGISMTNLQGLRLVGCGEVDLQMIGDLCPHVWDLILTRCTATPINPEKTGGQFRDMQVLKIRDLPDTFNSTHLLHLVSDCEDLRVLDIVQRNYLDNFTMLKLLKRNPMKRLHCLNVTSDRLTPDVVQVVFNYFGDHLLLASFKGAMMEKASHEFIMEMKRKIQPYCLFLTLGSSDL